MSAVAFNLDHSFLASFVHALPDAIFIHDDQGRYVFVNERACAKVGYSGQELLGMSVADLEQNFDLSAAREIWGGVSPGGGTFVYRQYRRKTGGIVPVEVRFGLMEHAGRLLYIADVRNIVDRHLAQQAELRGDAQFQNLYNNMREGYCLHEIICDAQGNPYDILHLQANPAYGEHIGKKPEEVIGRTVRELYPDIDPSWIERYGKVALTGVPERFEGRFGPLQRWFDVTAYQTVPGRFALVFSDITERREGENRLRQQAVVFKITQEGVAITDPDGFLIDANPAFEHITEYPLAEVLGKNMRFLESGRHDRAFFDDIWSTIAKSGTWTGEMWNRRKSGEVYLEWVSIAAVKNDIGEVVAYVGTHIDIGRMPHAQTELERLAHHDALTGLPNRLLLISRLEHAIERAKRYNSLGAVLFVDLDHFKSVNDNFGHSAGDDLLIDVGGRLSERLRDIDTLARIGGDEFVIVLEDIPDRGAAAIVADNVVARMRAPFFLRNGKTAHIGASVGISVFTADGDAAAELMEHADAALYSAKQSGRNMYRFFREPE